MNELMNMQGRGANFHQQLLVTVSTFALAAAVFGSSQSKAAEQDTDRPTVWIELGGQFEQIESEQEVFAPPFTAVEPVSGPRRQGIIPAAPGSVQKPLDYSYGAEGSISFQPDGSDWVFSAAARYGRSNGSKHIHHSTKPAPYTLGSIHLTRPFAEFTDAASKSSETHAILDFQAGKDIGLGISGGRSAINLGVRFAQFHTALQGTLAMDPNNGGYKYIGQFALPTNHAHSYLGSIQSMRSFYGVGPSVSWNGSVPFVGNSDRAEFTFDWGVNAAVLFGRQKASIHHQTSAHLYTGALHYSVYQVYKHTPPTVVRSRTVAVPNVGGMAGVSLKFLNARVSLGYRADFFFGAMDGGIDTRKTEDVGFYGPFATVSIGLP